MFLGKQVALKTCSWLCQIGFASVMSIVSVLHNERFFASHTLTVVSVFVGLFITRAALAFVCFRIDFICISRGWSQPGVSSVLYTIHTLTQAHTHLLHPWLICWVDAEGESVEIQIWLEADLFRWPPSIAIYGKLWPNHFHIFTFTRTTEKNKTISHTSFISGHKINWFTTTAQFYLLSKSINIKFSLNFLNLWIVIQNFFGLWLWVSLVSIFFY